MWWYPTKHPPVLCESPQYLRWGHSTKAQRIDDSRYTYRRAKRYCQDAQYSVCTIFRNSASVQWKLFHKRCLKIISLIRYPAALELLQRQLDVFYSIYTYGRRNNYIWSFSLENSFNKFFFFFFENTLYRSAILLKQDFTTDVNSLGFILVNLKILFHHLVCPKAESVVFDLCTFTTIRVFQTLVQWLFNDVNISIKYV